MTKREYRTIWSWKPEMKWPTNDKASITWLVFRNTVCVIQFNRQFCQNDVLFGDSERSVGHAFCRCSVVRLLCKLFEEYTVRIRGRRFLCSGDQFDLQQYGAAIEQELDCVLCLHGIIRVVIWTARQKEFDATERFSLSQMLLIFKHHRIMRITAEGGSSLERSLVKGWWQLRACVEW